MMNTIITHNTDKVANVTVSEVSFTLTREGKRVDLFGITNDNLPNCAAHFKALRPEEMFAIYEYMKKIEERA